MNTPSNSGALLFLYTESPLHVGAGAGLGAVDLPIQRERFSNLPVVPGSGLKGALREEANRWAADSKGPEKQAVLALFGPEAPSGKTGTREAPEFAGACSFVDARLLLFPVRSARGGWAWLTSPLCLDRLLRDLETLGVKSPDWAGIPDPGDKAWVGTTCAIAVSQPGSAAKSPNLLVVEDDAYVVTAEPKVDLLAAWLGGALPDTPAYAAYRRRLPQQLVVVSDTTLTDLASRATEVNTRVRLDPDTRTVQKGALWTEESLPSESLLWSLALFSQSRMHDDQQKPIKGAPRSARGWFFQMLGATLPKATGKNQPAEDDDLKNLMANAALRRIRLGGDQSTGRGLVGLRAWTGEGA